MELWRLRENMREVEAFSALEGDLVDLMFLEFISAILSFRQLSTEVNLVDFKFPSLLLCMASVCFGFPPSILAAIFTYILNWPCSIKLCSGLGFLMKSTKLQLWINDIGSYFHSYNSPSALIPSHCIFLNTWLYSIPPPICRTGPVWPPTLT